MRLRLITTTICMGLLFGTAPAQTLDMTGYRRLPGLVALSEGGSLAVTWDGERGQELRARLSIVDGTPTIQELAVRKKGGEWTTLGRDLVPEFGVTTGVRRTGHGLHDEHRWDVFWDAPLNHPDEVRRSSAAFRSDRIEVRTDGATAGGLLPRSLDGVLLRECTVHGLPGHQPAPCRSRRPDG